MFIYIGQRYKQVFEMTMTFLQKKIKKMFFIHLVPYFPLIAFWHSQMLGYKFVFLKKAM